MCEYEKPANGPASGDDSSWGSGECLTESQRSFLGHAFDATTRDNARVACGFEAVVVQLERTPSTYHRVLLLCRLELALNAIFLDRRIDPGVHDVDDADSVGATGFEAHACRRTYTTDSTCCVSFEVLFVVELLRT